MRFEIWTDIPESWIHSIDGKISRKILETSEQETYVASRLWPNTLQEDVKQGFGVSGDKYIPDVGKVEIKHDWRSFETGNAFFEVWNSHQNKPSGLSAAVQQRVAEWVHVVFDKRYRAHIFVDNPYHLMKWVENKENHVRFLSKCGDNNSDGYLVKVDRLMERFRVQG